MPLSPILVVDDEPNNLALLRQTLVEYPLIFATNGHDALEAANRLTPSLVLLDINMPGMSGYDTCERLKQNPATSNIPVIFVTAKSETRDETRGFAVGAVDYITKPFHPNIVKARVQSHLSLVRVEQLEKSYEEAIIMLGEAGHYFDADTANHVWRMAAYARAIAEALGLDKDTCRQIELAAPMHDTGKIGIPASILRKPGPLNDEEWQEMRKHPYIGWKILSKSQAPVFQLAADIALYHHEKWDGSGYPKRLAGEDIPLAARIVALADVFDALSTKRPYKEPWPHEKCLDLIREGAGTHFDPAVVDAFLYIQPRILELQEKWQE